MVGEEVVWINRLKPDQVKNSYIFISSQGVALRSNQNQEVTVTKSRLKKTDDDSMLLNSTYEGLDIEVYGSIVTIIDKSKS